MDKYQLYFIFIFLVGLNGILAKNLAAPLNFWNSEPDKIEQYRRHGKSCGPCQFPFEHKNQSHYACFKETEQEGFYCRTKEGDYVGCPDDCPEGTVIYSLIDVTSGPNNTFVLRCHVWGSPNPTGYWRKNGDVVKEVPPEDPYLVRLRFNISLRYDEEDYGIYSCYAANYFSSADSAPEDDLFPDIFDFHGQVLPVAPSNLKVEIEDTHANVSWEYEGTEPEDEISFRFFQRPGYQQEVRELWHLGKKYLQVRHLEPGTTYSVQVQARNQVGTGLLSAPLEFTIPPDAKIDRPMNVTAVQVDRISVGLQWIYDGDVERDPYIMFGALIEPGVNNEEQSVDIFFKKESGTVYNLGPYTNYKLTVFSQPTAVRRYAEPIYVRTLPESAYPRYLTLNDEDEFLMKLNCTAKGLPKPEITWKLDDKDLSSIYQPEVTLNEAGTVTSLLTLPRLHSNYGIYKCTASNIAGEGRNWIYLSYQKPRDKYIGDSIEDYITHMSKIISDLRKQTKQLQKENEKLQEALMRAARATTDSATTANVAE